MAQARKPILSLDFDGVLHDYDGQWRDGKIIGGIIDGALEFLTEATKHFDVKVHSSRAAETGGASAIRQWLARNIPDNMVRERIEVVFYKPAAHVSLDDRAIQFNGTFPPVERLIAFKPWWKRG